MFWSRRKKFRNLSLEEIKGKARILFIDDEDRKDIIDYLFNSGWKCRQLFEKDFLSLDQIDIEDSDIICVDINGVGEKLGKKNGLDIVQSIKTQAPEKKIIIYSSQSSQNVFHPAVDLADKKILKSAGDFEVFKNNIEELALKTFSWDGIVKTTYEEVKPFWNGDLTIEKYEKLLVKGCSKKDVEVNDIIALLKVSVSVGNLILDGVKIFL